MIRFHDVRTRAMKLQSTTHPHRRIHVAILPASNSLANHFRGSREARERLFAGSEFRVQARGRVFVCLHVLSQFLRPQKHVKYV
jgi:hypothetical protein